MSISNAIKPSVGPSVILAVELVLMKWTPAWLVGLLIGFTLFWLVVSILSNKAIIARAPWLRVWAPFLDPTGGVATQAELMSSHVSSKDVPISLLGMQGEIVDKTFENCVIRGPAIIECSGRVDADDCHFDGHPRERAWIVARLADTRVGAVRVRDTRFKRCRFIDIGFVETENSVAKHEQSVVKITESIGFYLKSASDTVPASSLPYQSPPVLPAPASPQGPQPTTPGQSDQPQPPE